MELPWQKCQLSLVGVSAGNYAEQDNIYEADIVSASLGNV